jgi:hypothetical protein
MKTTKILFALFLCVALVAGCSRGTAPAGTAAKPQTDEDAIKLALRNYLASRGTLNLDAMEMDVKKVDITGDTAQAQVEFRTKTGEGAMQMTYSLERQAGVWAVKTSQTPGMQTAHPPIGEAAAPKSGDLPASHPPIKKEQ